MKQLWLRSLADARALVLGCVVVLFAFHWLAVWMVSFINVPEIPAFLKRIFMAPMQGMLPIPVEAVGTYPGMLSLAYVDPLVLFTLTVYALARGSDLVSGQLDRGEMEMLLAQPLRRVTLFLVHVSVTVAGAALITLAGWLGTCTGLAVVKLPVAVEAGPYFFAAANLFFFTVFLAGLTTLISSMGRYRWRTIGVVGGFYVVQLILKVLSRSSPDLNWLAYFTFFGAFEPSLLANQPGDALLPSLQYNGVLAAMGITSYTLAAAIFCRRDLPAPL